MSNRLIEWLTRSVARDIPDVPDDVHEARVIRKESLEAVAELRRNEPAIMAPLTRIIGRAADNNFGEDVTFSFTRRVHT